MLKFTPPGRTVAPSGELRPRLSTQFATADNTSATWPWPRAATLISSPFSQQLFRGRCHPVRLKTEFSLELLERRRSAKCLHADGLARTADISLPSERGGLLNRDARL